MTTSETRQSRPGGRSARNRAAVHQAVHDLVEDGGLPVLTVPAIAARSGVHHTTIYRRWGDLQGILFDVLLEVAVAWVPNVDTGSLRGDLYWFASAAADTLQTSGTGSLVQALFAMPLDDEGESRREYWSRRHASLEPIFDRARERHEHVEAPEDIIEAILAPIYFRLFVAAKKCDQRFLERAVDQALQPAVPEPAAIDRQSEAPSSASTITVDGEAEGLASPTSETRPAAEGRGQQTHAQLLTAARTVFERDGFAASDIADIAARADTTTATFYSCFEDKEHILDEVVRQAQDEMFAAADLSRCAAGMHSADPADILRQGMTTYFGSYFANRRLMLLVEQVAGNDPQFRSARRARELALVAKNVSLARQWRAGGLSRFVTDPVLTVSALTGMLSTLGYNHLAVRADVEPVDLAELSAALWSSCLGLTRT